jgi:ABC-type uncharacterized transport system auxiliary subunit
LATDFLLLSNLRKFQVENDASGTPQDEKATPVGSKSTETVTAAFDTSLAEVMRRVVDWTLQQGSASSKTAWRAFPIETFCQSDFRSASP